MHGKRQLAVRVDESSKRDQVEQERQIFQDFSFQLARKMATTYIYYYPHYFYFGIDTFLSLLFD